MTGSGDAPGQLHELSSDIDTLSENLLVSVAPRDAGGAHCRLLLLVAGGRGNLARIVNG